MLPEGDRQLGATLKAVEELANVVRLSLLQLGANGIEVNVSLKWLSDVAQIRIKLAERQKVSG